MTGAIHARAERPSSAELLTRYRSSVMNTFGDPQRVLVRGEGATVWDADGNSYLDLLAGIAVNSLGHGHPQLVGAITEQLQTLGHVSNFFATEPQIVLAERLLGLARASGDGHVFFTNSGAEANEAAFKVTRKLGRTKIVVLEGSFHGRTMGALALTSKEAYRAPFEPLPGDVSWIPFGDHAALEAAVDDSVAAVLIEPIQGEAGVRVVSDEYLQTARKLTTEHGALLWFDEVQTGMGRTGAWFDHLRAGVKPDLITVAKGLGGGFPIGACIGIGAAGELLKPGNHGTTFGGNPLASAAANAVIDVIENGNLLQRINDLSAQFIRELEAAPGVEKVVGHGLLLGIVLSQPIAPQVQTALLDAGVIVNAPTPDRLGLAPPFILSDAETKSAIATIITVISEVST
ncbi:MAG: acetylornithine transaminase [Actinomycetales bacterium]|nr:acetylornithine transaminase [Actinomycetales bacterium]